MPNALWLADVLRAAGLKVAEVDGWKTRGHGELGTVRMVMLHHTAGPQTGNMPSLATVTKGRPDLAGPLCNVALGRDGTCYVVAAGLAYHAGPGAWQGITAGNSSSIGVEAENTGVGEPWPEVQVDAYARLCAAVLSHVGAAPIMAVAHREWATPKGRKIDPAGIDMPAFRARVAGVMNGAPVRPASLPIRVRCDWRRLFLSSSMRKYDLNISFKSVPLGPLCPAPGVAAVIVSFSRVGGVGADRRRGQHRFGGTVGLARQHVEGRLRSLALAQEFADRVEGRLDPDADAGRAMAAFGVAQGVRGGALHGVVEGGGFGHHDRPGSLPASSGAIASAKPPDEVACLSNRRAIGSRTLFGIRRSKAAEHRHKSPGFFTTRFLLPGGPAGLSLAQVLHCRGRPAASLAVPGSPHAPLRRSPEVHPRPAHLRLDGLASPDRLGGALHDRLGLEGQCSAHPRLRTGTIVERRSVAHSRRLPW